MLCAHCSKLLSSFCKKSCAICKAAIANSLFNICEKCSEKLGCCQACMRRKFVKQKPENPGGCKSCGGK
jgi:hypothetical protein